MSLLALETPLVERLKATLPAAVQVLTAADLANVAEGSQPTPAVHVVYDGYRVRDDGALLVIEETWATVIAVRNARAGREGRGARQDAAGLVAQVLPALHRFQVAGYRPLRLVNPQARPGYSAGYAYVPLYWGTTFTPDWSTAC